MNSRFSLILLVLIVLAFVSVNFFQLTKAETNQLNETQSATKLNPTTDSTETKTLTEAQKAIPDEVAFEVFLRTVGENNAPQLLQNAGFDLEKDSDKIERIMNTQNRSMKISRLLINKRGK